MGGGNRRLSLRRRRLVGSIPAWAGETRRGRRCRRPHRGLSPRGRGKQAAPPGLSPRGRGKQRAALGVYPRVGGGNRYAFVMRGELVGLSPRGRGKHRPLTAKSTYSKGLSPRGRGKRLRDSRGFPYQWSIPAWAGETPGSMVYPRGRGKPEQRGHRSQVYPRVGGGNLATWSELKQMRVYPRVGGGNLRYEPPDCGDEGLSPRGRGKPVHDVGVFSEGQVYPRVGGGNCDPAIWRLASASVYPRVGGGNPVLHMPRELQSAGSIPAWAGETRRICRWADSGDNPAVYPRVGGGNTFSCPALVQMPKVYPRVGGGNASRFAV